MEATSQESRVVPVSLIPASMPPPSSAGYESEIKEEPPDIINENLYINNALSTENTQSLSVNDVFPRDKPSGDTEILFNYFIWVYYKLYNT